MADPVTMAVVGGTAGAMLSPKDPLKGALLGAAGGYGGGALLGSSAVGGSVVSGGGVSGANAFIPGVQGGMGALMGESTALTGKTTSPGLISGTLGGLSKDMAAIGKFSQQNPVLSEMAMSTGMQALQPKTPQTGSLIQGSGDKMQFMQMPTQPFMPNRKISLI